MTRGSLLCFHYLRHLLQCAGCDCGAVAVPNEVQLLRWVWQLFQHIVTHSHEVLAVGVG